MKKSILIGSLALLVLIGAGIVFLMSNLNSIVAQAIEYNGSAVTDTDVDVSGVDIQLREGRGSVRGLEVGSPEGFSTSNVFELGDIVVDLDVGSVRDDPVILDEVRIQAPVVHAEINEKGALNLDEIRKQIQSYSGEGPSDTGSDSRAQKRIRIMSFVVEEGRVEVDASAIDVEARTVTLPEIRLDDVGGSQGCQ